MTRIVESGLTKNVSIRVLRVTSLRVLLPPVGFLYVSYHGTSTIMVNAQNSMDNRQKWTALEFLPLLTETHFYIIPIFSCLLLRTQPGVQTGFSFTLTFLHQTSTFTDWFSWTYILILPDSWIKSTLLAPPPPPRPSTRSTHLNLTNSLFHWQSVPDLFLAFNGGQY